MTGRPLLVYDGDCGFCLACVERGPRWIGDAVAYAPYQEVANRFPQVGEAAFREAVHLIEPDGRVSRAAEAVVRALELGGRPRAARLYRSSRWMRGLMEWNYRWVARNRSWLGRLFGRVSCPV